ncbi:hypothetical protein GobsT_07290 [Gemmata obscuriglobus]|uniref:Uncharacterized protein n=1 Tax=Gemmata obscuriglobus TaxID=114 RepID=A0A2Z3H3Z7_9BACT|nr:hypothetical protein [Gemmata obscuriglobus]AWM40733.1 hypothetical protein C1280_29610 [Gemmata obscuriglobus]QEG25994.1 hypothetical protein GobsT_07290 [Gemmata obscuriglobus]VTS00263.1 unnamed protein product [Gemmata obscuriglobus UQM 2246]
MPPLRSFALAALVALAPGAVARDAAEVQKRLATGSDAQKRLRVDALTVADGRAKLTGAFLDVPAAREGAPTAFATAQEETAKLVREVLKSANLVLDWSGVQKVEEKDHPHVVLQAAANAAGSKGDAPADRVLFASSRFGPDGAVVLSGRRGKDEAVAKWVAGAISERLAKSPAVKLVGEKPLVVDGLKAVEWKLTPADVQKLLATSTDAATRRLRADRVCLAFDAQNPDPAARYTVLHLRFSGVRLSEDAVRTGPISDACRKQWPELFVGAPRVLIDLKPLLGPGVPELAQKLQTAVAARPPLDGVRIDPGAEFDSEGRLVLVGAQPGLTVAGEKELTTTFQAVLKELAGKGGAASGRYQRLAEGAISVKRMKVVATKKVLAELREWADKTTDDARVSRVHFGADGALTLDAKTVTKSDGEKVWRKFKELTDRHLAPDGSQENGRSFGAVAEPKGDPPTFGASLTAHLRKEMAADQKKWNGVLIERGLFDADNRYTLRGVADSAKQNDELAKLLGAIQADPRWAEFFAVAPNKPALDVLPLSDLLDRVKRVTPAYPEFDGVRIEAARYDADVNLIFDATAAGAVGAAPAELLAKLIRDHEGYRRRVPAGKPVKIVRTGGPAAAGRDGFSLATGAQLVEQGDDKKVRAWLDDALLNHANESGLWYLSAYHNHLKGEAELVRRDLRRVIELEGGPGANEGTQRKRRYEAAKNLQGKARNELDALWVEYQREVKNGAKRITLTADK